MNPASYEGISGIAIECGIERELVMRGSEGHNRVAIGHKSSINAQQQSVCNFDQLLDLVERCGRIVLEQEEIPSITT